MNANQAKYKDLAGSTQDNQKLQTKYSRTVEDNEEGSKESKHAQTRVYEKMYQNLELRGKVGVQVA